MLNPAVIVVLEMLITVYGNDTDVNSVNMFDRNLVKIKLEGNADVSTATGLKNQEHSEMAVISEKILDIKKESEEHCELEVKTEASSDIEEENPEHLEMKFEIDQEYTEMLNQRLPVDDSGEYCSAAKTEDILSEASDDPFDDDQNFRVLASDAEPSQVHIAENVATYSGDDEPGVHSRIRNSTPKSKRAYTRPRKSCACLECGKNISSKSHLNEHMRIHTDSKPYKCGQCGKTFTRNGNLKAHLLTHTGEKPFECTDCGIHMARKADLKVHVRIHTGEKPYSCPACNKCFRTRHQLTAHAQSHINEQPYTCAHCNKSFKWKQCLIRHLKRCSIKNERNGGAV